jgi:hypothetical protein
VTGGRLIDLADQHARGKSESPATDGSPRLPIVALGLGAASLFLGIVGGILWRDGHPDLPVWLSIVASALALSVGGIGIAAAPRGQRVRAVAGTVPGALVAVAWLWVFGSLIILGPD